MRKKLIIDPRQLDIIIERLSQQLIETHGNFKDTVLLGLQPRGIFLADSIQEKLQNTLNAEVKKGYLDTTFHRDDFRRRDSPALANATVVDFIIEDKNVVLVDDVLYTGRSVRAALDAMIAFGRPRNVELLVLVDRRYSRHLPIAADYIGRQVNTLDSQKVLVEFEGQGYKNNKIWLINKE